MAGRRRSRGRCRESDPQPRNSGIQGLRICRSADQRRDAVHHSPLRSRSFGRPAVAGQCGAAPEREGRRRTRTAASHGAQCRSHPATASSGTPEARRPAERSVAPQRLCERTGKGPVSYAAARPGIAARVPFPFHTCESKSQRPARYPFYFQYFRNGPRRAMTDRMKHAWLGCLLFGPLLFAGTQDSDINVNTRYTVDTVTVAGKGWKTDLVSDQSQNQKMSAGLRKDLAALIGRKLNPSALDSLAGRLKKELAAREVSHRVLRGDSPDHVRVEFEVKQYRGEVGANFTKLVYNSKQGWSADGGVDVTVLQNSFRFGMTSDGDSLDERNAGISDRKSV